MGVPCTYPDALGVDGAGKASSVTFFFFFFSFLCIAVWRRGRGGCKVGLCESAFCDDGRGRPASDAGQQPRLTKSGQRGTLNRGSVGVEAKNDQGREA